jgi:hypothetical protein
MDWQNEPATWKQLRFLKNHGHKPERHLTKTAAAEIIQQLGGEAAISLTTPPTAVATAPAAVVHQPRRDDAFQLRVAVEQADQAASQAHRDDPAQGILATPRQL